jgi:hypothetical protein
MDFPKNASGSRGARCPYPSLVEEGVYVSPHALDRLREHHPNVGVRGALTLLAYAQEVESGLIAPFLGRSLNAVRDRYLVSCDRRGVFVIAVSRSAGPSPWTAVTYLRFGPYQQSVAEQLLGAA